MSSSPSLNPVGISVKSLKLPLNEVPAGSFTNPPSDKKIVSLLMLKTCSSFVVELSISVVKYWLRSGMLIRSLKSPLNPFPAFFAYKA